MQLDILEFKKMTCYYQIQKEMAEKKGLKYKIQFLQNDKFTYEVSDKQLSEIMLSNYYSMIDKYQVDIVDLGCSINHFKTLFRSDRFKELQTNSKYNFLKVYTNDKFVTFVQEMKANGYTKALIDYNDFTNKQLEFIILCALEKEFDQIKTDLMKLLGTYRSNNFGGSSSKIVQDNDGWNYQNTKKQINVEPVKKLNLKTPAYNKLIKRKIDSDSSQGESPKNQRNDSRFARNQITNIATTNLLNRARGKSVAKISSQSDMIQVQQSRNKSLHKSRQSTSKDIHFYHPLFPNTTKPVIDQDLQKSNRGIAITKKIIWDEDLIKNGNQMESKKEQKEDQELKEIEKKDLNNQNISKIIEIQDKQDNLGKIQNQIIDSQKDQKSRKSSNQSQSEKSEKEALSSKEEIKKEDEIAQLKSNDKAKIVKEIPWSNEISIPWNDELVDKKQLAQPKYLSVDCKECLQFKSVRQSQKITEQSFFVMGEILFEEENEILEYKSYDLPLPVNLLHKLKYTITSFLNRKEGTIFIGICDKEKQVVGVRADKLLREKFIQQLSLCFLQTQPKVTEDNYQIQFIPVKDEYGYWLNQQWVIRIKVQITDVNAFYFDLNNQYQQEQLINDQLNYQSNQLSLNAPLSNQTQQLYMTSFIRQGSQCISQSFQNILMRLTSPIQTTKSNIKYTEPDEEGSKICGEDITHAPKNKQIIFFLKKYKKSEDPIHERDRVILEFLMQQKIFEHHYELIRTRDFFDIKFKVQQHYQKLVDHINDNQDKFLNYFCLIKTKSECFMDKQFADAKYIVSKENIQQIKEVKDIIKEQELQSIELNYFILIQCDKFTYKRKVKKLLGNNKIINLDESKKFYIPIQDHKNLNIEYLRETLKYLSHSINQNKYEITFSDKIEYILAMDRFELIKQISKNTLQKEELQEVTVKFLRCGTQSEN